MKIQCPKCSKILEVSWEDTRVYCPCGEVVYDKSFSSTEAVYQLISKLRAAAHEQLIEDLSNKVLKLQQEVADLKESLNVHMGRLILK